jgi:sigma-E factor negative regulatory protein RseC
MTHCDAVVVEVIDKEVWVEVPERTAACSNCKTPEACQSGLLGLRSGPRRYRLDNQVGAQVGDRVQLVVAEGAVLRASFTSYLFPVLLAIAGAAIGQSFEGDLSAVLGTILGLGGGLAILRLGELRARHSGSKYSLQIQTGTNRFKEQS